ncbi:MAG: hypothetical protein IPO90_11450 [Flavobacteriales bacterium]|nr:hypothetical protein [Flavobacteriales bacterium]
MNTLRTLCATVLLLCAGPLLHAQVDWTPLGPDDSNWPSAGSASYQSLALDGSGNPVVAAASTAHGVSSP